MSDFEGLYPFVFAATALGLLLLERFRALQRRPVRIARRWTSNLGLLLVGAIVSSAVLPVGIYAFAQQRPPGFLAGLNVPFVLQVVATFLLLDLWKYWEHRAFHRVPLLWRLHLVHHSDTDVDVTTTERHHPLEVLASTMLLTALVALLGLPALGLAIYLLAATVVALYSHANLNVPTRLDRPMRALIVTAPVHAIHHSDLREQTDSNFGSVLALWDRLFGTYADPERAQVRRFGLEWFHRANDTRLARVLMQPFLFRLDLPYPDRADDLHVGDAAASRAATWSHLVWVVDARRALLAGALGVVLVVVAMWPAVAAMAATWRDREAYQYAWLVVPTVVYVVGWHIRSPVEVRPDFTGVWVVAVAAAGWIAATLMNIEVGRQLAFVLALQGVAMSTFGWRAYRQLLPAFALLFLMVPSGDLLQPPLRSITLGSIELIAKFAGVPFSADGFVIFIGTQRYVVEDTCSGLTYVTLATFLGYAFGLLVYRSWPRILAMALLGALTGIAANALRVNAIVLIDWWRGSQMDLGAHGTFQWIALFAALGILFYVLRRLEPDAAAAAPAGSTALHACRRTLVAPAVAGLLALAASGCTAHLQAGEAQRSNATRADAFPTTISGWEIDGLAKHSVDPERGIEVVETDYSRDGRSLRVIAIEALSPNAKLPESRLAPEERPPWREKRIDRARGCVESRCMAFIHVTWERDKTHQVIHVYYAYALGAYVTDSRFALRAVHGWHRLYGDAGPARLIGIVADDPLDPAELAHTFQRVTAAGRSGVAAY